MSEEVRDSLREIKESYSALMVGAPWISKSLHCALQCMEKAVGEKPEIRDGVDWLGNACTEYYCPKCKKRVYLDNYCPGCGQKIDWGESHAV